MSALFLYAISGEEMNHIKIVSLPQVTHIYCQKCNAEKAINSDVKTFINHEIKEFEKKHEKCNRHDPNGRNL